MNDRVAKGIRIFGAVLFVLVLGAFIWSMCRPPVTTGPQPTLPDNL